MNHISTALTNIRRSPYQSLSAILMLSITFFVAYTFSLFIVGTEQIMRYFETRPQIIAFFELDVTNQQIQAAEKEMLSKSYVDEVSVIDKQRALEIYQENNKEDPLLLELVTADILPASIEVAGSDVNSLGLIKEDLENLDGVEEVIYQQNIIDALRKWTTNVRYVGLASVSILAMTSLLIIMSVIAMKISHKRGAINIMRIIGASKWYIEAPFVYEGILYALFGSVIGWGTMYIGLLYVTPWLKEFLGPIPLLPIDPQILALQFGLGSATGLILTMLASTIAVQRVMRK